MNKIYIANSMALVNGTFAATVEAEYGDNCVEGTKVTLAHHGSRSKNPAPCCWEQPIPQLEEGDEILISHIDLDCIGGCAAVLGIKPECDEFWKAAAFVDVNGPHHIQELTQKQQDMLNAYYAWSAQQPRAPRYTEVTDVTEVVMANISIIERITSLEDELIEAGKEWREKTTKEVESKLQTECEIFRAFITDRVFCAGSYYSPKLGAIIPATVTLNTGMKAITIAFEDGGKKCSAVEIVQSLWGSEAGGRAGIAGSPRGWQKTDDELVVEFARAKEAVEAALS